MKLDAKLGSILWFLHTFGMITCYSRGWVRRLAFPAGTMLSVKPVLQVPLFNFAEDVKGELEISLPLEVKFDDWGWPLRPDDVGALFYPNSGIQLMPRRGRREVSIALPQPRNNTRRNPAGEKQETRLPRAHADSSVVLSRSGSGGGGDRAKLLFWIMKNIRKLGLDGKGCILRATCEIHQEPLDGYGLLGEMITLLFSVSNSALAEAKDFQEFLLAERMGKRGNCRSYYKRCQLSIFSWHLF